jgi:hypothetical protein
MGEFYSSVGQVSDHVHTQGMKSVADDLRREQLARLATLSMAERIALSVRLGEEAAQMYANMHGVSLTEAKRELQCQRQVGRRPVTPHCSHEPAP